MLFIGIITQALLYLCFAILTGSFLLYLVPTTHRPDIHVLKSALMMAAGGIAIFSFFPVLQIILYLSPVLGFAQTWPSVLFTFEVGKAWIFTFILANFLFIFVVWFDVKKKALYSNIGIFLTFILIQSLAWSSHASSIYQLKGFYSHSAHFTAVSVWVGILIVISWFSTNHSNWLNFLKWFSPVALVCLTCVTISGFILMSFIIESGEYLNSWMIPYGQTLLIKHLLIIPLLVYAVINSLFIKRKLARDPHFNPKPWAKLESTVILLIFTATSLLGQQSPPHETTISSEGVSKLFTMFYQGQFHPEMLVQLSLNPISISLIVLALLFLALIIISLIKKAPPIFSFLMGILLVFSSYFSLIMSIN